MIYQNTEVFKLKTKISIYFEMLSQYLAFFSFTKDPDQATASPEAP